MYYQIRINVYIMFPLMILASPFLLFSTVAFAYIAISVVTTTSPEGYEPLGSGSEAGDSGDLWADEE